MEKRKLHNQTSNQQKKKRKIQSSSKQIRSTLLRLNFPLLQHKKKKKPIKALKKKKPTKAFSVSLPHGVIIEILSRLPPKYLIKFSTVCKLWSTTIFSDYFASTHFLHYSQKNSKLLVKFCRSKSLQCPFFLDDKDIINQLFSLDMAEKQDVRNDNAFHMLGTIKSGCKRKLIGFCHGLVCLYRVKEELVEVCNPSRREILVIFAPRPTKRIKSYGFGYDSATNQYKVVFVFDAFVCMVFTLGGNPPSWRWREIPSSNVDDELLPRLLTFECPAKTKKSAVFCNGALYWKKQNSKPSELVMYDLHEEKFQIIELPVEYVDPYQLFEHKGSLCAARMEKVGKQKCIHLERLPKEKYNDGEHQMVSTHETFALTDKAKDRAPIPPLKDLIRKEGARMVTVHDQILLHWVDDYGRIVFHDIHRDCQRIVKRPDGVRRTHYYLTNHIENFRSLKTFVQEGVDNILRAYPSLQDIRKMNKKSSKRRKTDIAFLFSSLQDDQVPRTEFYFYL